ncbi:MAG: Cna B-type domain-containing protein, partial [Anaerotignum sp.]
MVCLSVPAMAAERIDLDADVSLTIRFKHGSDPIAGAFFELYRVADVSASGKYTLSGDFEDYPVSLKNLNSAQWRELANTLSGYAQRDDLTALDSGKTSAKGTLVFPNKQKSLKPGLYLVVGQRLEQGRYTYTPEPFLVCLPGVEPNGDVRDYDVVVNPKYDRDYEEPGVPGSSEITRKVLKVWKDNGNEKNRPQKITVQLLRDGKVYDTVTLNAQNNWRYTWSGLSKKYHWT